MLRATPLFLTLALLAVALPAHASEAEHRIGCFVGASAEGRLLNALLVLTWDEGRGLFVGTLEAWVEGPNGVLGDWRSVRYDVVAYEFAPLGVDATPMLDVVNDPLAGEAPPVYLVGTYAAHAPSFAEFDGLAGELGHVALAGTFSA